MKTRRRRKQVVRLGGESGFQGGKVHIRKDDKAVDQRLKHGPWAPLLRSLDMFTSDFMADGNQPPCQRRKGLGVFGPRCSRPP